MICTCSSCEIGTNLQFRLFKRSNFRMFLFINLSDSFMSYSLFVCQYQLPWGDCIGIRWYVLKKKKYFASDISLTKSVSINVDPAQVTRDTTPTPIYVSQEQLWSKYDCYVLLNLFVWFRIQVFIINFQNIFLSDFTDIVFARHLFYR